MNKKKIIIMIISISILSLSSSLYFDTPNFISTGVGLIKISFFSDEIVQIGRAKEIYLAKPNQDPMKRLIVMMEDRGYDYIEGENKASTLIFEDENYRIRVHFSLNRYYSKWVFDETDL